MSLFTLEEKSGATKADNTKYEVAHPIKFGKDETGFAATLQKRVDTYFKDRKISPKGNWNMYLKTLLVFALFGSSYYFAVFSDIEPWQRLLCAVAFGSSLALIAFNVGHDAAHHAYSESNTVNNIMAYSLNIIGVNRYIWNIKHNLSHHSFTNIPWADMDNENIAMARLTRYHPLRAIYRYQYLYLPFLWLVFSLYLTLVKDWQLFSMTRMGNNKFPHHPVREWVILVISKLLFIGYSLVLPFVVLDLPVGQILLGIFVMHACTGVLLACIFFFVHLLEDMPFPEENEKGQIGKHWFIHQLEVTSDFAPNNRVLAWIAGGLNQHAAHHLFPDICHVHYYEITRIIRETCAEFGIQYKTKGFWKAFRAHLAFLKKMGKYNKPVPVFGFEM